MSKVPSFLSLHTDDFLLFIHSVFHFTFSSFPVCVWFSHYFFPAGHKGNYTWVKTRLTAYYWMIDCCQEVGVDWGMWAGCGSGHSNGCWKGWDDCVYHRRSVSSSLFCLCPFLHLHHESRHKWINCPQIRNESPKVASNVECKSLMLFEGTVLQLPAGNTACGQQACSEYCLSRGVRRGNVMVSEGFGCWGPKGSVFISNPLSSIAEMSEQPISIHGLYQLC